MTRILIESPDRELAQRDKMELMDLWQAVCPTMAGETVRIANTLDSYTTYVIVRKTGISLTEEISCNF